MNPMNPPGFQERVEQLMREGVLFGSAVLQARAEFSDEPSPPPPPRIVPRADRAAIARRVLANKRAERQRVAHQRSQHTARITDSKRAHWAGHR